MKQPFWRDRWLTGRTGFHRSEVNDALLSYASAVFGDSNARILVPLCGMTIDLDWLIEQGHEVVGVEFVPEAVAQLKQRFGEPISITEYGEHFVEWRWSETFSVLQGDVFALGRIEIEPFDGIWDRASIVALDPKTRQAYAEVLLRHLRPGGSILMRTFSYDASVMDGPPFAVTSDDVSLLFQSTHINCLETNESVPDPKFQERGLTWQRVETFQIRH